MNKFGKISRLEPTIGRYFANCHEKDEDENEIRFNLLKDSESRITKEGLNSVNYSVLKVLKNKLYTLFLVYY